MEAFRDRLLPREFYARSAVEVAPDLLDCILVREIEGVILAGRISETEAYIEQDPASHSFRGKTARNQAMFGEAGGAYVYFTYGMHHCFNIVTGATGAGEAVLIRALEPLYGLEQMAENRSLTNIGSCPSLELLTEAKRVAYKNQLCAGPGRLCQAFQIDRTLNGDDLTLQRKIWVSAPHSPAHPESEPKIIASERVGITKATYKLWRFTLKNDPFVTRKRL